MTFNKILRYLILAGIFLIPILTPFIVSDSLFFPFITGKNFFFRIVVEIIFAAWIILALRDAEFRPRKSSVLWALGIFVAVLTLAAVFGEDPSKSFWSNYERMIGLITYLHLFAFFFVATSVLATRKMWDAFFHASLAASILVGVYGLFQLGGVFTIHMGGDRLDGTFGNSTYLAVYALLHMFLALYYALRSANLRWPHLFYGVVFVLNFIMLFYTKTRGAALGLFVGLVLTAALIAIFERRRSTLRRTAAAGLLALILLSGFLYLQRDAAWMDNAGPLDRLTSISLEEGTAQSRFMIWGMSWEGFKERPLLGWGQGNFGYVFARHYDPQMYGEEPWFDRAHNVVFDWLVAAGILGLLSYAFLYFAALRELWRTDAHPEREGFWERVKERAAHLFGREHPVFSRTDKAVLTGLLGAYLFQNLFVFDNVMSLVLFVSVLGYVHTLNAKPAASLEKADRLLSARTVNAFVAPVVVLLLIFGIYFLNAKPMYASSALIDALGPHPEEGLRGRTADFKRAVSYGTFGNTEIRERLLQRAMGAANGDDHGEAEREFFEFTNRQVEAQLAETPNNVRVLVFAGNYLTAMGNYAQAERILEHTYGLAPKKQTVAFSYASALIGLGKYEEAQRILKETYEAAPEYDKALNFYAASLIYTDEVERAKEMLREGHGTEVVMANELLRAYLRTERYDEVVAILEKRVEDKPGNKKYRLELANFLSQLGRKDEAVAEIRALMERDPDFRERGEQVIESIRNGEF